MDDSKAMLVEVGKAIANIVPSHSHYLATWGAHNEWAIEYDETLDMWKVFHYGHRIVMFEYDGRRLRWSVKGVDIKNLGDTKDVINSVCNYLHTDNVVEVKGAYLAIVPRAN